MSKMFVVDTNTGKLVPLGGPGGAIAVSGATGGTSGGDASSANQTLQLAQETAIATASGAKADAKATDATSSWSIVALLKGIFSQLSSALTIRASATSSVAVVASDSTEVTCKALYIGGAGNVVIKHTAGGTAVTYPGLSAGATLNVTLTAGRVMAATTATGIVAQDY